MSEIEKKGIGEHERSFEDPTEPFISNDGRDRHRVKARNDVDLCCGEVLDCSVDCPGQDECAADVECCYNWMEMFWHEVMFSAGALEGYR